MITEADKKKLVLHAVAHQETGRIPHMIRRQPAIEKKLLRHYQTGDPDAVFGDAVAWLSDRRSLTELAAAGILREGRYTDSWGINWHGVGPTRGYVAAPPLSNPSLADYTLPDSVDALSLDGMKRQALKNRHKYRVAKLGALWEQATFLRGMEELLLDLYTHPGFVHELLDGILAYLLRNLEVYDRELEVECIWLSDDYGTQRELLMSPRFWDDFISPRLKRLVDAVHSRGYHFVLHSDGNICEVLPRIVDMGVDLLNPVQPEAMDIHTVKKEYGRHITLWGGYGTQGTLMFGTPDQIRREVHGLCDAAAKGGGFILEPGLGFPNEMPLENAVAFIQAAREREAG